MQYIDEYQNGNSTNVWLPPNTNQVILVSSVCTSQAILMRNIRPHAHSLIAYTDIQSIHSQHTSHAAHVRPQADRRS
jgi:hypothetical protein